MSLDARYSRRAFLGLAAGVPVAATVTGCSGPSRPGAQQPSPHLRPRASRRLVSENALPGDPHWTIRHTGAPGAMMGYAGQASVLPGEAVPLYASTTARSFTVTAFRMGWYGGDLARRVWRSGTVPGHRQRKPALIKPTNTVEADWGPSLTVPTDGWPEGCYLLRLDAESGAQRFVPVTVRSASTTGKIVIKNAVETWQAYNTWGGYDLYHGPGGIADYNNRSLAVSLDRPYDRNGAFLFLYNERKLIELAERLGLPLAYATGMDIDADSRLLARASALISLGHDEYWSPPERAHVTRARDSGMNIAFLGANACFRRTRLARTRLGERRLVICYKTSYQQDPQYGKDSALVTSDWREPPHPDPESSLTGTFYESNPARPRRNTRHTTTWPPCTNGLATRSPHSTTSGRRSCSERSPGPDLRHGADRDRHVLLQEGHLWGRKQVAIPVSAVTEVDADPVELTMTKQQLQHLPPVNIGPLTFLQERNPLFGVHRSNCLTLIKAAYHAVSGSADVYNVVEAGRFVTMGQVGLTGWAREVAQPVARSIARGTGQPEARR